MGGGRWTTSDWDDYRTSRHISASSTLEELYTASGINADFNPLNIKVRESCDSAEHPNSTPIILGLDVTGSMGYLAEEIAKNALNKIITDIYKDNPVEDPQIMIMAIGDMYSDYAPLQVTQFESDIRIAKQLQQIYFESGGGGNSGESYLATWYFAARHTSIDCYNAHDKKGYLFTIGDEPNHHYLTKSQIKQFFGDDVDHDLPEDELLEEVSKMYNVYHICVGRYSRYGSDRKWKKILDEHVTVLDDHTKIPEVIINILKLTAEQQEEVKAPEEESTLPKLDNSGVVIM